MRGQLPTPGAVVALLPVEPAVLGAGGAARQDGPTPATAVPGPRISEQGARIAASKLRLTVAAYREHEAAGEAWCSGCRDWRPRSTFTTNEHRPSGVASHCRACMARLNRRQRDRQRIHAARTAGRRSGVSYAGPAFVVDGSRREAAS